VCVVVSHVLLAPQSVGHVRGCPQLSVAAPQCVLQKFGSGVHSLVAGPSAKPASFTEVIGMPASPPPPMLASSVDVASASELRPESALHPQSTVALTPIDAATRLQRMAFTPSIFNVSQPPAMRCRHVSPARGASSQCIFPEVDAVEIDCDAR
jgi:hypothetical protein